MKVNVKSNNQKGGIIAGIISYQVSKNNKKKVSIIAIMMLILAVLTFFGIDQMFKKNDAKETYKVKSINQSGGVTAGKIENFNIINPKPESKISYKSVFLNKKVDGFYKSEFLLTLEIPKGGFVENILFSKVFLNCEKIFPKTGDILGGSSFGLNGEFSTQQIRFVCTSSEQVIDDGDLFRVI